MKTVSSLYIHIPFCVSKCKYCDFFSVPVGKKSVPEDYVKALCNELSYRIKDCNIKSLKTVYIGGGTPSLLSCEQLNHIFSAIKSVTEIENGAEITIEVNPDDVTDALLQTLEKIGINRISCGIQSMCNDALVFASRRADVLHNKNALNVLKNWKGKLSLDIICGLPYETEQSFFEGLDSIIDAHPDHISMYSLTIEEETPFGQLYDEGKLGVDFDFSDSLWLRAKDYLLDHDYLQYEVSNFAKIGSECKHNIVYWNHEGYLGCGCGGTGSFYNDDGTAVRISNKNDIKLYCDCWLSNSYESEKVQLLENVNQQDSVFEYFMMGLRKMSGIQESDFIEKFNMNIPDDILNKLIEWNKNNLCEITGTAPDRTFTLGKSGILYLNKFLQEIL